MQEMRTRMVGPDAPPPVRIYARADRITDVDHTLLYSHHVNRVSLINRIRILDPADGVVTFESSGIANLTAGLSIERRTIQNDLTLFSGAKRLYLRVVCDNGEYARERRFGFFIAREYSRGTCLGQTAKDVV